MEKYYSFAKRKINFFPPETHKNVCVCLHRLYASQPINPVAAAVAAVVEILFFDSSFVYIFVKTCQNKTKIKKRTRMDTGTIKNPTTTE